MKTISSHTKVYCIFGNPVEHSLSPLMHNAAFEATGVDAVYVAFRPSSIKDAIAAMRTLPIYGASITIPYKTSVIEFLDEIDPLARDIGAVNTLCYKEDRICGHNTDGYGAIAALTNAQIDLRSKRVLILGNGGSARAIAFTLLEKNCTITIAGRNPEKFMMLVEDLRKKNNTVEGIAIAALDIHTTELFDIIINTTSVGMVPYPEEIPIPPQLIFPHHTVFDIVYRPHWTALLRAAAKQGARVVFGIDMLIFQGARQFELWTGIPAPVEAMRNVVSMGHV
ncbi:MAG: shikimate dehydrogenase [Spirochaetes bacterium]|nr:shikimate dehydrogenase [Spirochaetota bacterium]